MEVVSGKDGFDSAPTLMNFPRLNFFINKFFFQNHETSRATGLEYRLEEEQHCWFGTGGFNLTPGLGQEDLSLTQGLGQKDSSLTQGLGQEGLRLTQGLGQEDSSLTPGLVQEGSSLTQGLGQEGSSLT